MFIAPLIVDGVGDVDVAVAADIARIDSILDSHVEPLGLRQHPTKKEILCKLYGVGALVELQCLLRRGFEIPGKVLTNMLYLGSTFSSSGSNNPEVSARIRAAERNWYTMKNFWSDATVFRVRKLYCQGWRRWS